MTVTNSFVPPPELVEQWRVTPEYPDLSKKLFLVTLTTQKLQDIATQAAQWGADQELEACCAELPPPGLDDYLRAARRPKLWSLKEQALAALREACEMANDRPPEGISNYQIDTIRRALKALDD
jgi:hypothetical protein